MKEYTTKCATIRIFESNIIENVIHKYKTLDAPDITEIKEINKTLSQNRPYVLLVDSEIFTSITKEGRELSASKEFSEHTLAKALMVSSLGQKIVGMFYIRMNKPHIKTKIFSDRQEAISWLKQQLKQYVKRLPTSQE